MQQHKDLDDLWVQHQRRNRKTVQSWACIFCPDRKIFMFWKELEHHGYIRHRDKFPQNVSENELCRFLECYEAESLAKRHPRNDHLPEKSTFVQLTPDMPSGQRKRPVPASSLSSRSLSGLQRLNIDVPQDEDIIMQEVPEFHEVQPRKRAACWDGISASSGLFRNSESPPPRRSKTRPTSFPGSSSGRDGQGEMIFDEQRPHMSKKQLWTPDQNCTDSPSPFDPSNTTSVLGYRSRQQALQPSSPKSKYPFPCSSKDSPASIPDGSSGDCDDNSRKSASTGDASSISRDRESAFPRPRRSNSRPIAFPSSTVEPRATVPLTPSKLLSSLTASSPVHWKDSYNIVMQPETRPILQEQLVAEAIMIEAKSKLNNEQLQALTLYHHTAILAWLNADNSQGQKRPSSLATTFEESLKGRGPDLSRVARLDQQPDPQIAFLDYFLPPHNKNVAIIDNNNTHSQLTDTIVEKSNLPNAVWKMRIEDRLISPQFLPPSKIGMYHTNSQYQVQVDTVGIPPVPIYSGSKLWYYVDYKITPIMEALRVLCSNSTRLTFAVMIGSLTMVDAAPLNPYSEPDPKDQFEVYWQNLGNEILGSALGPFTEVVATSLILCILLITIVWLDRAWTRSLILLGLMSIVPPAVFLTGLDKESFVPLWFLGAGLVGTYLKRKIMQYERFGGLIALLITTAGLICAGAASSLWAPSSGRYSNPWVRAVAILPATCGFWVWVWSASLLAIRRADNLEQTQGAGRVPVQPPVPGGGDRIKTPISSGRRPTRRTRVGTGRNRRT